MPKIIELQNINIQNHDLETTEGEIASEQAVDRAKLLIDDLLTYHPWNEEQVAAGVEVTEAAKNFMLVIATYCPQSPARSRALNMVADARMVANASITHGGNL